MSPATTHHPLHFGNGPDRSLPIADKPAGSRWAKPVSEQLYDYKLDPHETQNLAGNATYAALIKELSTELEEMLNEG